MPLRSTAQGSVAVGKISGASVFGLISDRFGRKKTFIFAAIIFMIAAPSAAFVNSYGMFIALRLLIGFASAGVYETAYTILMEITVKNYRIYLGNIFNIAYSIGLISLPVAAYFTNNWRHLQLAISVPMFALIIHCWFLPESPRWLLTRGKLEKKSNIRGSGSGYHLDYNEPLQSGSSNIKNNSESWCQKVLFFLKGYLKLFSTFELTKRTLICSYLWFLASLYYYIIALNGTNFGVDPYLYMALNGIIDLPGCLLPIFLLTYFGRKSSGIALYTIFGISMAVLTVLPQGWPIMFVTLVGRLLGIAAGGIIPFHVVELFPTENRNTAVGSCIAVSQFGPLIAPYIVGIGGKTLWWIPTAICGFLTILGALLLLLLPETRDSPMLDTILEMKTIKKEAL